MSVEHCINLNSVAIVRAEFGTSRVSLEKLCQRFLGYELPKDHRLTTDWSGRLDNNQVGYAARDAWCSFILYSKLAKGIGEGTGLSQLPVSAGNPNPNPKGHLSQHQRSIVRIFQK